MMKLQLRKMQDGMSLVLTDEEGEMLPSQMTVQVIGEKVIVEFGLWTDGIALSNDPPKAP
jgi:hypothetical protein